MKKSELKKEIRTAITEMKSSYGDEDFGDHDIDAAAQRALGYFDESANKAAIKKVARQMKVEEKELWHYIQEILIDQDDVHSLVELLIGTKP